jgi:cysteine desulfurase
LSAHKAYGPKGAGALLVSRRKRGAPVQLTALQFGGGQELGLRAGTVATHQVVGMGLAFELARTAPPSELERVAALREQLWQGLAALGGTFRNGDAARSVPHLLNVSIDGVEGESLLAAVRGRLAVSTGSACSSASREPSYVLRALGRDPVLCESSLRFGLGRFTRESDIDAAIAVVAEAVSRLRRVGGLKVG